MPILAHIGSAKYEVRFGADAGACKNAGRGGGWVGNEKKQPIGIVPCGATEVFGSDSACGVQDLSSEEEMESRGEEEDYWFWKEPPDWPHFAIWDGVQDGSSKEELVSREKEKEKEDRFSKTPSAWIHVVNQDGNAQSSKNEFKIQEEEEEKEDSTWKEPPEWSHFAVQDGMPALYSEECFKYYEVEDKEHWSEDPEWLHVAAQDSGQDGISKQDSQRVKKKQEKKIGFLFNLLKDLITPFRMVQKINQDDKRQSGGYSSRSWIDLQENLMDGIISSSKRWTKQDELWTDPLRYSESMRKYQE